MLPLPKLQFLASAGLDKKIVLWDLLENTPKREYKGFHKRGIVALDFNENLILLISGGIDHEIFVWNPYILAPVYNLTGHASPIIGLAFIPNPLHIISIDADCVLKVWDVKKFKCIDSMSIDHMEDKHSFRVQGMCIIKNPLKILMTGKNVYTFGYDKNNNITSADENVAICTKFVPEALALLTPVGNKVKLWNILTGEVKKIFSELSKTDISVLILDSMCKRFFMGDVDGNVGVYNVTNGALLKSLSKHKAEIIALTWGSEKAKSSEKMGKVQFIISASIDNCIKVHEDRELGESELIRTFEISKANITSMIFEQSLSKLIVGCNNGTVGLYEPITGKGNEEFVDKENDPNMKCEVTSLAFIDGYDMILFANSLGKIKLLGLPPLVVKNRILYTMNNYAMNSTVLSPVIAVKYCPEIQRIFVADEKFYLRSYDVRKLFEHLDTVKLQDKAKRVFNIGEEHFKLLWIIKAHDDSIRSLEYIESERLLVTTSADKNVRIFASDNGRYIESLRQNKLDHKISPIAYKKVESLEIYTPRMEHRIDSGYITALEKRKQREREIQRQQELGFISHEQLSDELFIEGSENVSDAFKEYEEQEFNPFYYTTGKIDREHLEGKKSNEWKLKIDFEHYYKSFETSVDQITKEVKRAEKELMQNMEEAEKNRVVHGEEEVKVKAKAIIELKNRYQSDTAIKEAILLKKLEEDGKKQKKKASSKAYESLYREGLKHGMIKTIAQEGNKVKLSESEKTAAENLAKALAAHDEHDPRVLKFTEFQTRKDKPVYKKKK